MVDMNKWMRDVERRLTTLEKAFDAAEEPASKEERAEINLLRQYGEHVDKTVASQILGVPRATVYAMLADGRIMGTCSGRKVSVRSIARYIAAPKPRNSRIGCRNRKKEGLHGADALEEA